MAGHSKWANIKHRKGAQDAARAKVFGKLSKEITVAVVKGGPDVATNPSLRLAVQKAKAKSMPKTNIENAIKKGNGVKSSGADYKEITYSGSLKGGIILLIISMTDNHNRLSSDIQYAFKKSNGVIGKQDVIPYNFQRMGVLEFENKTSLSFDDITMIMLEVGGVIDIFDDGDNWISVHVSPSNLDDVKSILEKNEVIDFETDEVQFIASDKIQLSDEDVKYFLETTIPMFESNDDVEEVYHNVDLSNYKE